MNTKSLRSLHVGFTIATAAVGVLLIATLALIEVTFSDYLIGTIEVDASAQILTRLDLMKFDSAQKQLTTRQQLPYAPEDLKNPFNPVPTITQTPSP